jgi:cyclophilin family peptidyl-prolyl cis-trans isomerase
MSRFPKVALAGALVLLLAVLAQSSTAAAVAAGGCAKVAKPVLKAHTEKKPTTQLSAKKVYEVTLKTNCGSFTIRMDQKQSPNAAAAFVALAQRGFFNGTIFHRIVPGFVIQGGDPTGTGTGGPGFQTVDTPPKSAKYTHGVVAMAKTQTDPAGAAGSQFFVVTVPDAQLPPDYAIIGKVVSGLPVVDRIGKLGNPQTQLPTQVIEIQRATVKSP